MVLCCPGPTGKNILRDFVRYSMLSSGFRSRNRPRRKSRKHRIPQHMYLQVVDNFVECAAGFEEGLAEISASVSGEGIGCTRVEC